MQINPSRPSQLIVQAPCNALTPMPCYATLSYHVLYHTVTVSISFILFSFTTPPPRKSSVFLGANIRRRRRFRHRYSSREMSDLHRLISPESTTARECKKGERTGPCPSGRLVATTVSQSPQSTELVDVTVLRYLVLVGPTFREALIVVMVFVHAVELAVL